MLRVTELAGNCVRVYFLPQPEVSALCFAASLYEKYEKTPLISLAQRWPTSPPWLGTKKGLWTPFEDLASVDQAKWYLWLHLAWSFGGWTLCGECDAFRIWQKTVCVAGVCALVIILACERQKETVKVFLF